MMTPKKYAELLEFIAKNNSWGARMYDVCRLRNRRAVKYVDASFDTRDGTIWKIKLRQIVGHDDMEFSTQSPEEIAAIFEFLNEPLS